MRRILPLLAMLAVAAPLSAQDAQPEWVCDVEVREGQNQWSADKYLVSWSHWLPDRANVAIYAHIYDDHGRYHFEEEGPFSRWSYNSFIVSPKTMRTRGQKLWAQLTVGERSLEPKEVSRRKGFFGIASFRAHEVKELIGDAEELTITFYDRKQTVVGRYSVPRSTIVSGAERMPSIFEDYQTRLTNPQEYCDARIKEIIFSH
jgi:hypothetical protein